MSVERFVSVKNSIHDFIGLWQEKNMIGTIMRFPAGTALIFWVCLSTWAPAIETDFQVRPEMLEPVGQYYDATVPDTLDLAERARLSVHGLTASLNEKKHYEPYGHGLFNTDPPFLTTRFAPGDGGGAPNWGKISDAIILTRSMCGSRENLDIEAGTLDGNDPLHPRRQHGAHGPSDDVADVAVPTKPRSETVRLDQEAGRQRARPSEDQRRLRVFL